MPKMFECPYCGEEITASNDGRLIGRVKQHARDEHDTELEGEEIRDGIKNA